MSDEALALIDTNVLVYAGDELSPNHEASLRLCDSVNDTALCIAPQVILEYVSTVTNPKRVTKVSDVGEAWADAEEFLSSFRLIAPRPDCLGRIVSLAKTLGISKSRVYDLALAVTMLDAGVSTVYTYDDKVFSKVPGITAKTP